MEVQFCIDFRKFSSVLQFNAYPMPHVDHLLNELDQAAYLASLDLMKGYWQIPIALADTGKNCLPHHKETFPLC